MNVIYSKDATRLNLVRQETITQYFTRLFGTSQVHRDLYFARLAEISQPYYHRYAARTDFSLRGLTAR
jgi:hypothetical protein